MARFAPIIGFVVLTMIVALAAIFTFQDKISLSRIKPRTPFQAYTPPPPPEYGARGAWILWPSEPDLKAADVFYVHSTTYYKKRNWNGPITSLSADRGLRRAAAPNEAGPFMEIGAVYGPRYRQATLFSSFTHKYDGIAARQLAYKDVQVAFEHYLKTADPKRPLILVGYDQGALHTLGLLKDYFQTDTALRARLAAAYIIGQATPVSLFDEVLKSSSPCTTSEDIRCVISYIDLESRFENEIWRMRNRSMVWSENGGLKTVESEALLCVNPLSWTTTTDYIGPEHHLGAASATGLRLGTTPPAISKAIGARCIDGILVVDTPRQEFLRRGRLLGAKWRAKSFNLFYRDLTADAERRVHLVKEKLKEESRFLGPIEEAVDLNVSPVNKVP